MLQTSCTLVVADLTCITLKLRRENMANTLLIKLLHEGKISLSNITGFIH